jgi:hypothetical protein
MELNFYQAASKDGKVLGEVWYDVIIVATAPGKVTTNSAMLTKQKIP